MPNSKTIAGVVGFFDDSHELVDAARKAKDANYMSFDAFTPYPVHGLDAAMKIKRSPIPYVTFVAGLTGFISAFALEYWTSAVDWPLNVAGKPFNSWPAFVPVMFELTILFAGLATFGALLLFCGLPNIKKRVVDPSVTRDRFALLIEAPVKPEQEQKKGHRPFSESEAADFLKKTGAKEIRTVYAEGWFE
jgi:hypothetical protein